MLMRNARPGEFTVLVLERERDLRDIIAEGLSKSGYQVVCALTTKHAGWICRDHRGLIDLLLADVTTLGERPLDCLQTIIGAGAEMPVLLMSAYDRESLRERHGALLEAHQFIGKPFTFFQLAEAIEILLQHQTTPGAPRNGLPDASGE